MYGKCRGHKVLEMFRGDDATCNRCLARRKKNGQAIQTKSGSRKYGEEHKEEKKAYNQEWNRREAGCKSCGCKVKKCNWLRHLRTKKHRNGVENKGGGGDMGGEAGALAQSRETSKYVYVVHQIVPTRNQTKAGCNFNAKSLCVSVSLKVFVMQTRETYK